MLEQFDEERKEWLENAILDYLKNNPGVDSVDIVSHFKLRCDITLASVKQLEIDNKIIIKQPGWANQYYTTRTTVHRS